MSDPMTPRTVSRFDWHDSSCGGMDTTGFDGKPLTLPCDCGMPDMFRSAYESGRGESIASWLASPEAEEALARALVAGDNPTNLARAILALLGDSHPHQEARS